MPITTTTDISAPVNVVLQAEMLRQAKANCPYFVGSEPAEIAEHSGTFTAKWRRYENLTPTTTPLTELTGAVSFPTRVGSTPTITDVTATVQKYGDFIVLNEEVELINVTQQSEQISKILGIQAGRSLNRLQRNELEDNLTAFLLGGATTATNISGGSTASANIKQSDIQAAVNALDRNDAMRFRALTEGSRNIGTAPVREAYIGLTHADAEQDIRMITGFQGVETYASQTDTYPNEFGTVGGIRYISTTEATAEGIGTAGTGSATVHGRAATSGRTDVYNTVVLGQYCHGSLGLGFRHIKEVYKAGDKLPGVQMISKAKGSAGAGDPLNEISTVGWKTWHAPKVLNGNWGRVIRHTVDRLTTNE